MTKAQRAKMADLAKRSADARAREAEQLAARKKQQTVQGPLPKPLGGG